MLSDDAELAALMLGQVTAEKGGFAHVENVATCIAQGGSWVGGADGSCQMPSSRYTPPPTTGEKTSAAVWFGVAAAAAIALYWVTK